MSRISATGFWLLLPIFLGSNSAVVAAEYSAPFQTEGEVWFISPAETSEAPDGIRRAMVYQVSANGRSVAGKTIHFSHQFTEFDCAASTFRPVTLKILDDEFGSVGTANFPPDTSWKPAGPTSPTGRVLSAVCNPPLTPQAPAMIGSNWKEVAASLLKRMQDR